MALGTVSYAEHDHVLQELFHERLRARNLEADAEQARRELDAERKQSRELIAEVDEQVAVVNRLAAERGAARAALVEIGRLSLENECACGDILRVAQCVVGTIISRAPYGAGLGQATAQVVRENLTGGPSLMDMCTVRDTTTDQSRIRNGEPTQAEREAFWNEGPPDRYHSVSAPELMPTTWIVFEQRIDAKGWREICRHEGVSANDAITAAAKDPGAIAPWGDEVRTMTAAPASALGPGFAVTTKTTTDTQVTVVPKET